LDAARRRTLTLLSAKYHQRARGINTPSRENSAKGSGRKGCLREKRVKTPSMGNHPASATANADK